MKSMMKNGVQQTHAQPKQNLDGGDTYERRPRGCETKSEGVSGPACIWDPLAGQLANGLDPHAYGHVVHSTHGPPGMAN